MDITTVADTKKSARRPPPGSALEQFLKTWVRQPWLALLSLLGLYKPPPENPFAMAAKRYNQMITLRLSHRDGAAAPAGGAGSPYRSFFVGTYHMPCQFRVPQMMMVHCALAAQHVQRLARLDPYVLAGDFNIKPIDAMYTLLTTGEVPDSVRDASPLPHAPLT